MKTKLNHSVRQSVAIKLIQNHQIKTVENMRRRVLITGGAGFIGSHTCLVLLEQGSFKFGALPLRTKQ